MPKVNRTTVSCKRKATDNWFSGEMSFLKPGGFGSVAEPTVSRKRKATDNFYTEQKEGTYSAILIVEGTKLYVIHEHLARYSEVFRTMFSGKWKESKSKEVQLAGKSLQSVIYMLDYMYQEKTFKFTDEVAVALLPLAVEYQIECLQKLCCNQFLLNLIYYPVCAEITHIPSLEMLTLAETHHLDDLKERMLIKCAARLNLEEINRQRLLSENKALSDEAYNKLLRLRLENHEKKNPYAQFSCNYKYVPRDRYLCQDDCCGELQIIDF